jgi:hypothetical protein
MQDMKNGCSADTINRYEIRAQIEEQARRVAREAAIGLTNSGRTAFAEHAAHRCRASEIPHGTSLCTCEEETG